MKTHWIPTGLALAMLGGIGWLWASSGPAAPTPAATSVNGVPTVQHVILISVDGLRGDYLASLLTNRPNSFPNFRRLRDGGASTFRARTDYAYTETIPNHSCMITGRPVLDPTGHLAGTGHGFTANTGNIVTNTTSTIHQPLGSATYSYKSSVFDVTHESGRATSLFHSKDRMAFFERSWSATYGALGAAGVANPAKDKIDRYSFTTNAGTVATAFVNDAAANPLASFTMLHFVDPDTAGHGGGWVLTTPPATMSNWENAVVACDTALGRIFTWLDAPAQATIKPCTTIVLTADHGGANASHLDATLATNFVIPFFITGPGFQPASDAYSYFANRTDPGVTRVSDATGPQPIRNGDVANLSLALLGLPAVPGSYFHPELKAWPPPNVPPTYAGYAAKTDSGVALPMARTALTARGVDTDGGTLSITTAATVTTQGRPLLFTPSGADWDTVTYTPADGFAGLDTFEITLSDGQGGSVAGLVTIQVLALGEAGNVTSGGSLAAASLQPNGDMALLFFATPNLKYRIQRSQTLGNWTTLATRPAAADGTLPWVDADPPAVQGFYRVVIVPQN